MRETIVQVVTQQEAGGAQRVAFLLHEELLGRGLRSELWFLYRRTNAFDGAPHVYTLWPRRPGVREMLAMLLRLGVWMLRARPRAVIAHTHYANCLVLPAARLCGVRNRIAVHHNAISTYPRAARWLEGACKQLGFHSQSIAVSLDVQGSLMAWKPKLYDQSLRCIYNGLRDTCVSKAAEGDAVHFDDMAGRKVLFCAGRLTEQKNHLALVEALPELPDCVAVIAGCGPLEAELRKRAEEAGVSDRVKLLGEVGPHAVAAWMRRADVFVFPSRFEAMPMALLEAMRAGMTIVASDIAAHREIAKGCAVLCNTAPSQLAAAIRKALEEKHCGNALGAKAHERSKQFRVSTMTDAYLGAI